MQLRLLLVPLLAALPCSCTSPASHADGQDTPVSTTPASASQADAGTSAEAAPEMAVAAQEGAAQDATAVEPAAAKAGDNSGTGTAGQNAAGHPSAGVFYEAAAPKPAQGAAKPQEGSLSEDQARLQRQREQGAFLAGEFIQEGDRLLERADLEGALKSYSSALEVDPSSQPARDKMHKVEALMGDKYAGAATFMKDATEQEMVRRAQARLAAEDARVRGKNALSQGEYDTAIEQYRQAELILRYNPLIATDSLDLKRVTSELETAIRMSEEAHQSAEQKAMDAARAARELKEKEEAEYRENKLRTLYAEANTAFLNENYGKSEQICAQILLEDPGNKAATELRQVARDMFHSKTDEENRSHYREQWIRTMEEIDTMNVLQNTTIEFNDLKRWAIVANRKPLEFSNLDASGTQDKQAILNQLDSVRFAPKFMGADGNGSSLTDVASFLQITTGVNFMISPKVMSDLDDEQRTIKLDLPERSVRKVLDTIAEIRENLRWKIEDGIVKFVTKDELKGGQVLREYEVRDLTHKIEDFAGREMNVAPSGGVQLAEEDKVERETNVITGDALDALIRNNIAKASWDADPQNSVRISPSGTMVVNQTPEVHEQISKLLDDLREATGIMVDIQARFLKVEDNFLEDIGVDFRGLGQPGLGTNSFFNDFGDASTQQDLGKEIGTGTDLGAFYDRGGKENLRARVEQLYDTSLGDANGLQNSGGVSFQWTYLNDLQMELILRAVSKSERVELVTSPRITVHNTARGNLSVLNQVAYVQDFNVEIAQAASIADPIVNVVQDGVVLDVRPVVSADRRFITLELRPTIANLKRPIREVVTTLGSQNSVTIQLPEVEIQKVRTSIPMPDGGTVMLGGLKISDKQDNQSGVPILNKIPIVSFFFNRKGQYVSNRKLLILLKAGIVIPQEHEPTPAQLGPTTRPAPSKP
jgi:Flp pilus assembly secretin CpaC/tetratricopeptide (TPR) repeat protein